MNLIVPTSGKRTALACQITGYATLRVGPEEVTRLRRQPGPWSGPVFPVTLLKHSDEQTVAALAVLLRALANRGGPAEQYRAWGVVAAPTLFGRDATHDSLVRFRAEGAWGMSPHIIPHFALHAVSGTISQALKIHGPNFGVSGGPSAPAEGLLVAASLLSEGNCPGVWLVLTGHDSEKLPRMTGDIAPCCEAVALALQTAGGTLTLQVGHDVDTDPLTQPFSLASLRECLDDEAEGNWRLPGTGWAQLRTMSTNRAEGCS